MTEMLFYTLQFTPEFGAINQQDVLIFNVHL